MSKILIDVDKLIKDMEDSKYTLNQSSYTRGCNDVLNYYIKKLKEIKNKEGEN